MVFKRRMRQAAPLHFALLVNIKPDHFMEFLLHLKLIAIKRMSYNAYDHLYI